MNFCVIGGGIVGLAVARQLHTSHPGNTVTLLEKETRFGTHQSTHNSGVLHAGLYYKPGSEKARLSVLGIRKMVAFCQEHGVAHEICGKLVVATDQVELERLHALHKRGLRNGLTGLVLLGRSKCSRSSPMQGALRPSTCPKKG